MMLSGGGFCEAMSLEGARLRTMVRVGCTNLNPTEFSKEHISFLILVLPPHYVFIHKSSLPDWSLKIFPSNP